MTVACEILGALNIALVTLLPIGLFLAARRQDRREKRYWRDYAAMRVAEYGAFLNDDAVNFLRRLK